jgi:hypothetical protein
VNKYEDFQEYMRYCIDNMKKQRKFPRLIHLDHFFAKSFCKETVRLFGGLDFSFDGIDTIAYVLADRNFSYDFKIYINNETYNEYYHFTEQDYKKYIISKCLKEKLK